MPDIGTQLRDARTEAGIEIATAEYATKIRSKYLRALESGDWAVLPEETSAKSFLRTYADYLGLDGRALVEVFKAGQPDANPAITPSFTNGGDSAARGLGHWRTWLVVVLVVLLIVGLFLIGSSSNAAELTTAAAGGAALFV